MRNSVSMRRALAAFDPGDRGLRRAAQVGELPLRQAPGEALLDDLVRERGVVAVRLLRGSPGPRALTQPAEGRCALGSGGSARHRRFAMYSRYAMRRLRPHVRPEPGERPPDLRRLGRGGSPQAGQALRRGRGVRRPAGAMGPGTRSGVAGSRVVRRSCTRRGVLEGRARGREADGDRVAVLVRFPRTGTRSTAPRSEVVDPRCSRSGRQGRTAAVVSRRTGAFEALDSTDAAVQLHNLNEDSAYLRVVIRTGRIPIKEEQSEKSMDGLHSPYGPGCTAVSPPPPRRTSETPASSVRRCRPKWA